MPFRERIALVEWARFCTAYGPAIEVPDQLIRLAGGGKEAMKASHNLWCGLCHQHAYVSSAALPALPFLLEVLDQADEALTVEILDILLGFAVCTVSPPSTYPNDGSEASTWVDELRGRIVALRPRIEVLAGHANEDIAAFAQLIIENLDESDPGVA